jgi:hypothetical protein
MELSLKTLDYEYVRDKALEWWRSPKKGPLKAREPMEGSTLGWRVTPKGAIGPQKRIFMCNIGSQGRRALPESKGHAWVGLLQGPCSGNGLPHRPFTYNLKGL